MGTGALLVVSLLGLLAGLWLLWRLTLPQATRGDTGMIAVVVPARNEAISLPALLESLVGQWPAELVVVDDHSADRTAAVARDAGATVIAAPELPDGWTGKSWACWTGAGATTAPVLVFVDADVRFRPGGLANVVGELERRGGIVGVQPFHVMERPYERLAAFFNLVGMMGTDGFTPLGDRLRPTATFGPCLATTRADYLDAGGHEAVKGEVLEDAALARRYEEVSALGGRGVVDFRMYPEGLGQLVEGFTKNFGQGAAGTRPVTLALVFLWIAGAILAVRHPVTYCLYVVQLLWMLRRIGSFGPLTAALYPIPLAFFLVVFVRSLVLTYVRREVRWRGRTIKT